MTRGCRVIRPRVPDVLGLVLRVWSEGGREYARVFWDTMRESTTETRRLVVAGEGLPWPYDPNEVPF